MFVYMLLCQDDDGPLYVKIGVSLDPQKRLRQLWAGCPVTPQHFAVVETRSPARAKKIEAELLTALGKWRHNGEWLFLSIDDKAEFNSKWKAVFERNSETGWKLAWTQMSVKALRADSARRRLYAQKLWRKRGKAFQDFVANQ